MARLLEWLFPGGKNRFGGYEALEQIAQGGMSAIWKARHCKTGEIAAVKLLTARSIEVLDIFKEVFEAEEGEIALQLSHPNVIRTYQYGRKGKRCYYVAMEFVDGPNLERLIVLGDKRVRENRADIIVQMGRGLQYIHQQGLIHRDFCPKNVLYGSDGVPKIIDFGLAIPDSVKRRTDFDRAGTASYMAPEQVRGQKLDQRTDIYAFGLSVFEVLTGRRPFPGTGARTRKMQQHLNLEPLQLTEVDPSMPEELEIAIGKCIEKQPHLRYNSMEAVMVGLQTALPMLRC